MPNCTSLRHYAATFRAAGEEGSRLFDSVDREAAERRPEGGGWSLSECVQHLNRTAEQYFPKIESAIERGKGRGTSGTGPFTKKTFLGGMILGVLDPKANKKFKAPKIFRPNPKTASWPDVQTEFLAATERLRDLCEEADGLDLDRVRLASPIGPWPKMTLREAFEIHSLHIPRHLEQGRRALG